ARKCRAAVLATPRAQSLSLEFTTMRNVHRLRRHSKITPLPVLALHQVLFVAWSPVRRTVKSHLTPMAGRLTPWLSSILRRLTHPGAWHLTPKSTAQTVTRVCSSLTQTVQSVRSQLAVAGWVAAATQLQCAVMLHPSVDISAASFSARSSHRISM